jgi:hypothetical protein
MATNLGNGIFSLQDFYNRGVTKLAPDVLVYISGSSTTQVIAPVSSPGNNNLSFNDGITNVTVSNVVDPPGASTANIEIVSPIYGPKSKYWVFYPDPTGGDSPVKAPLFVPMMEVKIFFKGRYLVKGQPRYYPAFWGLINTIEETYSGGVYKILLGCVDMLHWWAYSTINVHPVPESNIAAGGGQDLTVYATIFREGNPYQILYKLTENMGMHQFVSATWVAQKNSLFNIYPPDLFKKVSNGIMSYWQERFANIGGLLKMYGIFGERVNRNGVQTRVPETNIPDFSKNSKISQAVQPKDDKTFQSDTNFLQQFNVFFDFNNMGTFEHAEYMTKLDIATEIKTRCNFEFFQDTNGDFIFKPPFYNMNVKGLLPYTILPSDIMNYSNTVNTEEIITVMQVTTPMAKNLRTTSFDQGIGLHMDIDLAKRYGIRFKQVPMEFVNNASLARSLAVGQMGINNAKAVTGSITIPGRPEMKLGYPVYVEHKDAFYYVRSIGHSFDFGGSFTTTLGLETERKRIRVPINLQGPTQSGGSLTGWSEPLKDQVYRFINSTTLDIKSDIFAPQQMTATDTTRQTLLINESKISSMQQGLYAIQPRATTEPARTRELAITDRSIPYTDEDGFQVLGAFPYGRNLNPICVSSETSGPPTRKDVYLTTMARPIYQSESDSMAPLFFEDREGSVPSYLNIGSQPAPKILGDLNTTDLIANPNIQATLTPDQAAKSNSTRLPTVTAGEAAAITFATSSNGQNSYVAPGTALVGQPSTYPT